ncbi:MAG: type II secretion system F family protein [Lachnospiraceae bacterium]
MKTIVILIAICAAVAIYNLICLFGGKQEETGVRRRIGNLAGRSSANDVRGEVLKEKKQKQKRGSGLKLVSEKLEGELEAAGIQISGEEYLRIWVMVTFLPALILLLLGGSVITAFAFMILGLMIPPILVGNARKKRSSLFDKQLGEALLIMSNSLRAGYTFQQSMEGLSRDMQPPLSDEFKIVIREIDMGASMETALKHMVERTKNEDVKILVSAVLISSQVGANLADVLDNISGTIKGRLEMKEQIKVLTAQGRISGMIVGAIPVFLFLIFMIINPSYIGSFIATPMGIGMLMIGVVMEALGFIVINRMVDLKY